MFHSRESSDKCTYRMPWIMGRMKRESKRYTIIAFISNYINEGLCIQSDLDTGRKLVPV